MRLDPGTLNVVLMKIERYGRLRGDGDEVLVPLVQVRAHIAALEQERDTALADNAAHDEVFQNIQKHTACVNTTEAIRIHLAMPHPGAALLEEHRKALVKARNEGLEKAAKAVKDAAQCSCNPYAPCTCDWSGRINGLADDIRAMKEPVPCCERDHGGDGNCDRHPGQT
jgi:hypothetical protein